MKLKGLWRWLIERALNIANKKLTKNIANPFVRFWVGEAIDPTKEIVGALLDDNPNNAAQIEAELKKFVGRADLQARATSDLVFLAEMAEIDEVAIAAENLVPVSFEVVNLLIDSNSKDKEQLKELWEKIKTDGRLSAFIIAIITPQLEERIEDEALRQSVLTTIELAFKEL